MQMNNTMICCAEYKNHDSELPAFGVTVLWTLQIVIPVIYLCPFYNLKMVSEMFLKSCNSIKQHKNHKSGLITSLSYESLNIENNSFCDILVNVTQM